MAIAPQLSDHPLSTDWLRQFSTTRDQALAAQLLNRLKLISEREFESEIEKSLISLQKKLKTAIAVYPISKPKPHGISGYNPFTGGAPKGTPYAGKRSKFGSEDRVGHLLVKLQERFKKRSGVSTIECTPTTTQLKTQGIRHLVLVDDICGSGRRIVDFWNQLVPKRIKSLLSYKRLELWIVLYGITRAGYAELVLALPRFPIKTRLLVTMGRSDLRKILPKELSKLCIFYAGKIGMKNAALGYRDSACALVFEHGCPNNLPAILWSGKNGWRGLFPNGSVPTELRSLFPDKGVERTVEDLWSANQPHLSLALLDAVSAPSPLATNDWLLLAILGLRSRGVKEGKIASRLMLKDSTYNLLISRSIDMGLYSRSGKVTSIGKEYVSRFKNRFKKRTTIQPHCKDPTDWYPLQCEGKLRAW